MGPPGMFCWNQNFCGTALTSVKPKDWMFGLVSRRASRWYRTNTGTSKPSSVPMAYSVLGLVCNRVKPSSRLVCQFLLAVPDIPQLQLTTWHRGSINQERLCKKHRIPGRKIQTCLHMKPSLSSPVTSALHQLLLWTVFQLILKCICPWSFNQSLKLCDVIDPTHASNMCFQWKIQQRGKVQNTFSSSARRKRCIFLLSDFIVCCIIAIISFAFIYLQ